MCVQKNVYELRWRKGEVEHSQESADLFVIGTSQVPTCCRFVPLPEAKSKVWKYFAFEADDNDRIENNTIVLCHVMNCSTKIAYQRIQLICQSI